MKQSLSGVRVAVPEARAADILCRMFEERGAIPHRVPMIGMQDTAETEAVEAWLENLMAGEFDDVVLYTGEGLRRLLGFAQRMNRHDQFIAALGGVRKFTRGPKPVAALREIGLDADVRAPRPTTDGLAEAISSADVEGHAIGVQLYPNPRVEPLLAALETGGAEVSTIIPYSYVPAANAQEVAALIERLHAGQVDVIAFTSAPQARRLGEVAKARHLDAQMTEGLKACLVAAVGPVVSEELRRLGREPDIVADEPYALKSLVRALEDRLGRR